MLRLLTRVTLGATARDGDLAAENQADNDAPLHDDEGDDLNLHHFEAPDHPQIGAIHESDHDHDIYDDSSTDIESESEDVDLRENLLTTRHHHRSRHSSNRVIVNRSNKHKRKQMRLTSRKRHVVASTNGSQLSYHHPTIQAKQNQMYLITTLLPNQPEQTEENLINKKLPKELLLRVFSYLDIVSLCRSAQVCRSWNTLAMDGSNWMQVDLFRFQKDIRASVVESLARRCGGFLKVLSLRGCENIQDSALRSFALKCNNIERLYLNKCKRISDDTTEYLGLYCHRLVTLDLENCVQITDKTLKYLSNGCKYLQELNISWCMNVTDKGLRMIIEECPNLQSLFCKGCEAITSNCFAQLAPENLAQLHSLNLFSCVNVIDETVEDIANNCPNLEYLCLSNCREITDRSLVALSQSCTKLKDLELALCSNLTDVGFMQLAKTCHDLERMDLEDCNQITDLTLHSLNVGCPHISSLSLSHCELLTDTGLAELCGSHFDIIQVLELDNCPLITDAAFEFMKPLRTLERIDLYDCQQISKDAIRKFKAIRPEVEVQAYFAPNTPPTTTPPSRQGICRCCVIL
uniref:F-box domain-containing protein n=1 Tax=Panagrellus redivivus TaxID=6233 RepID=A0A7E4W347_PANRE